jgi:hypothetical protein
MRRVRAGGLAALVLAAAACGPEAGKGGGGTQAPASAPSGLVGRVGEVLELTVPLVGGGQRGLAELRGTPVLLELADASEPDREAVQRRWRALVEQRGDAVAVVCVAMDADPNALPASWIDDPPPFVLGWDPQGAIAARLQLRVLPTVVLLDAQGRIVGVHEEALPDETAIERWLGAK